MVHEFADHPTLLLMYLMHKCCPYFFISLPKYSRNRLNIWIFNETMLSVKSTLMMWAFRCNLGQHFLYGKLSLLKCISNEILLENSMILFVPTIRNSVVSSRRYICNTYIGINGMYLYSICVLRQIVSASFLFKS